MQTNQSTDQFIDEAENFAAKQWKVNESTSNDTAVRDPKKSTEDFMKIRTFDPSIRVSLSADTTTSALCVNCSKCNEAEEVVAKIAATHF